MIIIFEKEYLRDWYES